MPPRKRAAARTPDPIDTGPHDFDAPIVVPAIVDAKAQMEHGGAIPAQIVGDSRDTFLRRVTIAAFIVIAVVFLALIFKAQFAQARRLHQAERERNDLIQSLQVLTTDVNNNSADLRAMRQVLQRQNAILKAAGLTPATIPSLRSGGGGASTNGGSSTPRSQPSSQDAPPSSSGHRPDPRPSSHPSSHPSPKPRPSPSPTSVIQVCVPGLPCIRPLAPLARGDVQAVHWLVGFSWRAIL